jgi:hypothetical protein
MHSHAKGFDTATLVGLERTLHSRNSPVFEFLWKNLEISLKVLRMNAATAVDVITVVDRAPRHDSLLDNASTREIAQRCKQAALIQRVQMSIQDASTIIAQALSAVAGNFHGELRVRTEDRISKHLKDTIDLLGSLEETRELISMPQQPFLVRQLFLSDMLIYIPPVLRYLKDLRVYLGSVPDDQLLAKVAAFETRLNRMKAVVTRWRDNPSQRVSRRLSSLQQEIDAFYASLVQKD